MNIEFIKILEAIRVECGFPLHVSSGYRTPEHNMQVGKTKDSAHTHGLAVDFPCTDSHERFKIVGAAYKLGIKRIETTEKHVHLDMDFTKPQEVFFFPPK